MTQTQTQITPELLAAFAAAIKEDYAGCNPVSPIRQQMIDDFKVSFDQGSSYIKVVTESSGSRSVHSFIVVKPSGKFQYGDILKAASWKAPAKNFARGNILNPKLWAVRWTGGI
jgi:hypothetical protein